MVIINRFKYVLTMLVLMATLFQCSTAQKLQKEAPINFGEVYCQTWVAGIQGGGSGLNLYIPTSHMTLDHQTLDSVYFRGQVAKLEIKEGSDGIIYVGRFQSNFNQPKDDVILSSDQTEEYQNKLPIKTIQIPFELGDDECVVSYQKNDKTLNYKISNIVQKAPLNYPSAPPNRR